MTKAVLVFNLMIVISVAGVLGADGANEAFNQIDSIENQRQVHSKVSCVKSQVDNLPTKKSATAISKKATVECQNIKKMRQNFLPASSESSSSPKAKDLKVKKWFNRKLLVKQLVKDTKRFLDKKDFSGDEKQKQQELQKLIDDKFFGEVEKYVDAITPNKVDVSKRGKVYVICFMKHIGDGVVEMNAIQKRWGNEKVQVLGLMDESVRLPLEHEDMNNPENWPQFWHQTLKKIEDMGLDMPRYLIGFDSVIRVTGKISKEKEGKSVGKVLPTGSTGFQTYLSIYSAAFKRKVSVPSVCVVNLEGEISWFGEAENVHLYIENILNKKYQWKDYLKHAEARWNIRENRSLSSSDVVKVRREERILFKKLTNCPEGLVELAHTVMWRKQKELQDLKLVRDCLEKADTFYRGHNLKVLEIRSQFNYESGEIRKAIEILERIESKSVLNKRLEKRKEQWIKTKKEFGVKKFFDFKRSERYFYLKVYPLLKKTGEKFEDMENHGNILARGYCHKPRVAAALIYDLLRDARLPYDNKNFIKMLEIWLVGSCQIDKLDKNSNTEDHIVFSAYALFFSRKGKKKEAKSFMNKAIDLLQMNESDAKKNKKTITAYKKIIEKIIER